MRVCRPLPSNRRESGRQGRTAGLRRLTRARPASRTAVTPTRDPQRRAAAHAAGPPGHACFSRPICCDLPPFSSSSRRIASTRSAVLARSERRRLELPVDFAQQPVPSLECTLKPADGVNERADRDNHWPRLEYRQKYLRQRVPCGLIGLNICPPAGCACQATYAPIGQRRPTSIWPSLSAANAAIRSASCSRGGCCIAESRPCPGKAGAPRIGDCASAPERQPA
jgi:hypothetical protein